MFIKWILYFKIYLLAHFNFEELIIEKTNFKLNPYFYINNKEKLSISFYEKNNELNLTNFLEIRCKKNWKIIKLNKSLFIIDSFKKSYRCISNKCFINISFDSNNLFFNFNNIFKNQIKFKCDWKFLEIKFLAKIFKHNSKISNIQISDNIKLNLEYLNPLILVNLKQEPINNNYFTNKFGLYFGGINGSNNNLKSKLLSEYNKELNGVNWIINNKYQHIKLEGKIISNIFKKLDKKFTIYINFDITYKISIKDVNKSGLKKMILYSIYNDNLKKLLSMIEIQLYVINNILYFNFFEAKSKTRIISFKLDLKDKNNLNKFIKYGIGIKNIFITYNEDYTTNIKIMFKNNSPFYKGSIFELKKNLFFFLNKKYDGYKHFIGNYNNKTIKNYTYINSSIIIHEYGIFSGLNYDKIEKTNTDINLILDGKRKLVINNNYNLDRRFSLNNKNKILNCLTKNCILCSKNEICWICRNGYFWDKYKNCIFNFNKNHFVNEYSELINIKMVFNNIFTKTGALNEQMYTIDPSWFEKKSYT